MRVKSVFIALRTLYVRLTVMKCISSIVALLTLTSLTWIFSAQELPVITLRRTACYGFCPVYSL